MAAQRTALFLWAWMPLLQAANAPQQETARLVPCRLEGVPRAARCGAIEVPENRDDPSGRRLSIAVAVVPAADGAAVKDPIAVLMGGPGEDAISAASLFTEQFGSLLQDRDLLLVDQRGTGKSHALRCRLFSPEDPAADLRDFFPPAAVRECARELTARADLTQYTYSHFADDLEQVRRALGYGPLNLFAGSYGTRAAQVFLRKHPESVRTVYLGSVVPIDVPTPPTFARTTEAVLDSTFAACQADSTCRAAFPNLEAEFAQILERLDAGAVTVALPGRSDTARLNRGRVTEWFRALLYRPSSAAALPRIIHRAYEGDWSPIVAGILSGARDRDANISLGLFFAITCNEDVAFMTAGEVQRATADTVLGDYRPMQQIAACEGWPQVTLPADYRQRVRSSAPTMFVSGDADSASPLWFTERVAPGFPNRIEIVLENRGHTEWSECLAHQYERFVREQSVRGPDPAACRRAPRPLFETG